MKKFFTASFALVLALSAGADTIKILSFENGSPLLGDPQMSGLGLSPNGRYVCGAIDFGEGVFVFDLETQEGKYEYVEDSDKGGELRHVDNNGLAIGFADAHGVTYSASGVMTELAVPNEIYSQINGEDITNDGSVRVGSLVASAGFITNAAYSVNGGEWTMLPLPPAEVLGRFKDCSSAKYVSGDGKYIAGHAGSFGPILLWTRNEQGTYDVDALYTRFCALTEAELPEKPLGMLVPYDISDNGLYVLCYASKFIVNDEGYEQLLRFPAVYNTETKELKCYDEPQEIDYSEVGLKGSSIANDGTFVGIVGEIAGKDTTGSFIMKPGETQAQLLSDAFPAYAEVMEVSDNLGYSFALGISADATKIMGYGYYSEDFYDDYSPAYWVTYVIDTDNSAVDTVGVASASDEIYSLDGVRLSEMKSGLNIVRSADGSVRKVIK